MSRFPKLANTVGLVAGSNLSHANARFNFPGAELLFYYPGRPLVAAPLCDD